MKLPIGEMKVMVPVDKVEEIGLRNVISSEEADEVLDLLRDGRIKMSHNWNKRFRTNMEKIKSGDIFEVAKVVRNLTIRDNEKGLSTGEKKMLNNSRQILVSELVLAKDMEREEVEELIDNLISQNPALEEGE